MLSHRQDRGLLREPENREEGAFRPPNPGRREPGVAQKGLDRNGRREGGPKGGTRVSKGREVGMPSQERMVGGLMAAHWSSQGRSWWGSPVRPCAPPFPFSLHCWEEAGFLP